MQGAIYAGPKGSTQANGTRQQPMTLPAALEKARATPSESEIILLEGHYALERTIVAQALVRSDDRTLTVRSEQAGRQAVLSGARSLRGLWQSPDSGDPVVRRMPSSARGAVRVVDLSAAGISDFGSLRRRAYNDRKPMFGELFIDGQRQPIAGYPNPGQNQNKGDARGIEEGFQKYAQGSGQSVELPAAVASRWNSMEDVWVHGYFGTNWIDSHLPVRAVDGSTGRLTLGASPTSGVSNHGAYRVYNLPEELDTPGEWYLHRPSRKLYFWPQNQNALNAATFSELSAPILHIAQSRNMRFENIIFEGSRDDLLEVSDSTAIAFWKCQFRGAGNRALTLYGQRHRVEACHFSDIGGTAIEIGGGSRDNLFPSSNLLVNNYIHDYGQIYFGISSGVFINGTGNVVAHNLIAHAPHQGIQINGALNRIFRNEIADVCNFSDDSAAIYSGREFLAWGNDIVENYIHDIRTRRTANDWVHGVYLDDFASGFTVQRNVIAGIHAYATNLGGGRHNILEGNLILDSLGGHLNDNRGAKWIVTTAGSWWNMFERISFVDRHADPWKTAFPGLAKVPASHEAAMAYVYPDGNEFTHNAGDRVSRWTHSSDWTAHKGGVFQHYAQFDGTRHGSSVASGTNLANISKRADISLKTGGITIPFSRIGLQDDTWNHRQTTQSSAVATFSWNSEEVYAGSPVTLFADHAWSPPGDRIASYSWSVEGKTVGTTAVLAWTPPSPKTYRVTLKIITAGGARDESTAYLVARPNSQRAKTWLNAPQKVAGSASRVELTYFDHDRFQDYDSRNNGGQLRSAGVDIGRHNGTYYIGWTQPGEWFELSVQADAGTYDLFLRAASRNEDSGVTFRLNDEPLGGIVLPDVGNNTHFQRYRVGQILIPHEGVHRLRLDIFGKDFNLDHVELVRTGSAPSQPSQPEPEPEPAPTPAPSNPSDGTGGTLKAEWFYNVAGPQLGQLTRHARFPHAPDQVTRLSTFELPDTTRENFGIRVSGWIVAPQTGDYTFWIASDDNGALRLSADEHPDSARQIASVDSHTPARNFDRFSSQRSTAIRLEKGKSYYIEALMNQGWSSTNLAVAWQGPGFAREIIPASALAKDGHSEGGSNESPVTEGPQEEAELSMGKVAFARYDGVFGKRLDDLFSASHFPDSPHRVGDRPSFDIDGSGYNFGLYLWAWIVPERTGNYTFWLSSDDEGVLSLSPDADSRNAKVIARVDSHTLLRNYDQYSSQKSATVRLEAGKAYYIESIVQQGWGGAHVSVAWEGPGFSREIIPGSVLGLINE